MIKLSLDGYHPDRTADILSNPPENIDEHWAAHNASRRPELYKVWLTTESWERIEKQQGLQALLAVASDGGRDAFELQYRAKFREVRQSVSRDGREFTITLVSEAEDAAERNDFTILHNKRASLGSQIFR